MQDDIGMVYYRCLFSVFISDIISYGMLDVLLDVRSDVIMDVMSDIRGDVVLKSYQNIAIQVFILLSPTVLFLEIKHSFTIST
jgi:hypothetical protein